MCAVYLFYTCVYAWFDAMRVFCFCTHSTHACYMCVLFKLWVICTIFLKYGLISETKPGTVRVIPLAFAGLVRFIALWQVTFIS